MAIGWIPNTLLIGDATHGCRLLVLTQCHTTTWHCLSDSTQYLITACGIGILNACHLLVAAVKNIVLALALDSRLSPVAEPCILLLSWCWCYNNPNLSQYVVYFSNHQVSPL